jgi:hypothetical protein
MLTLFDEKQSKIVDGHLARYCPFLKRRFVPILITVQSQNSRTFAAAAAAELIIAPKISS